jgi:hypothetical protein
VSGVQPHSPAVPPPPQVSYWLVQEQFIMPLQPSETLPHSWLPSVAVAALQARGVQHLEVALTHSSPLAQPQVSVPPQLSVRLPHIPG